MLDRVLNTSLELHFLILKKQLPDVFYKKGILKNFAKFARKHQADGLQLY